MTNQPVEEISEASEDRQVADEELLPEELDLEEQHRERLKASAVPTMIATSRRVRSAKSVEELKKLGFRDSQAQIPAMVIPVWDVSGKIATYQIRPDVPRLNVDGKPVKYELPVGSRMVIDVHPNIQPWIGNPNTPLWITEGVFKADAAIGLGFVCIDLLGVWNWRGTNEHGGKVALPDWESIALDGREVYLAFDSDVMKKPEVYGSLVRLSAFLKSRKARVFYVYLPHGEDGSKTGLDDYIAQGHSKDEIYALATNELRQPDGAGSAVYENTETGLVWYKRNQRNVEEVPLANFSAVITEDISKDDGAEVQRLMSLETSLRGKQQTITIPAAQFPTMNWVNDALGPGAIIEPGNGLRERVRHGIQTLSGEIPQRHVYAHTGWRRINGVWVYLHAEGAIGSEGLIDGIEVELSPPLRHMALPDPGEPSSVKAAVKAAVQLFDLLPAEIVVPLLGAVFLAPLRAFIGSEVPDFVLWLHGPSGTFKSEYMALAQGFFGAFTRTSLPANFSATANAIERFLFEAKDGLIVIDDFHPAGDFREQLGMNQVANRVLRGAGNIGGRARMRQDTTLRPALYPRALVLVSGERLPTGHSNMARMFSIAVEPGMTSPEQLTQAQNARDHYPLAMAGYIQHLVKRVEELQESLPARFRELRDELQVEGHRREPGQMAHLLLGLECFFDYAVAMRAMTVRQRDKRLAQARQVLLNHAKEHAEAQAEEAVDRLFLRLLTDGIASKRAYLEAMDGGEPKDSEAWGWVERVRHDEYGIETVTEWVRPSGGQLIGVLDRDRVLLFPEATYQFLGDAARRSGRVFPVEQSTLVRRLDEAGLLLTEKEGDTRRRTVNVWINGGTRRVLKLRAESLFPTSPPPSSPSEGGKSGKNGKRGNHYGKRPEDVTNEEWNEILRSSS